MLEDLLKANTEALEANTKALIALASGAPAAAVGETAAAKKKREAAEKAAADAAAAASAPTGPTLQEFRDVASKIVDKNEGKLIEEIAKKHGLARCSAAHGTDKAQVVYDDLVKALKSLDL